jgi:hypothetical protein
MCERESFRRNFCGARIDGIRAAASGDVQFNVLFNFIASAQFKPSLYHHDEWKFHHASSIVNIDYNEISNSIIGPIVRHNLHGERSNFTDTHIMAAVYDLRGNGNMNYALSGVTFMKCVLTVFIVML